MEQAADRLCGIFGIGSIRNKYPAEISGGRAAHRRGPRPHQPPHAPCWPTSPPGNLDSPPGRAVIDAFLQAKADLEATIFHGDPRPLCRLLLHLRAIILAGRGCGAPWPAARRDRRTFQDELLDAVRGDGGGESDITLP